MKTKKGDIFKPDSDVDAIFIPTNGTLRKDRACVMGRGTAKWATELWPGIQFDLGREIKANGNIVNYLGMREFQGSVHHVYSFPVKHNWWEDANILLITRSARQAVDKANTTRFKKLWMPAIGCGNGKLSWPDVVEPTISGILDDRFTVIFWEKK